MGAAVSDKSIVVVGGAGVDGTGRRVDAYNVQTKTWSPLKSLPVPRMITGATTIKGKIYVAGGTEETLIDGVPTARPTKTLLVYDPATNTWRQKAELPGVIDFADLQTGLLGRLYVYGSNHFWAYTPATDKWAPLPLPPSEHSFGIMISMGGKLYLTGGFHFLDPNFEQNPRLDVYDPATRRWTTRSPIPAPLNSSFAATFHGKLWVAGGENENSLYSVLQVYDPVTDTWAFGPELPIARAGGAAAWARGKFFVIGGRVVGSSPFSRRVDALSTNF